MNGGIWNVKSIYNQNLAWKNINKEVEKINRNNVVENRQYRKTTLNTISNDARAYHTG